MPRRLAVLLATFAMLVASGPAAGYALAGQPPSETVCANRANVTAALLLPCIRTDDLWNHMQAFQDIADANPGPDGMPSRNSGEPGYKASVDYVAKLMKTAGYSVTIQPYTFDYFAYQGVPSM